MLILRFALERSVVPGKLPSQSTFLLQIMTIDVDSHECASLLMVKPVDTDSGILEVNEKPLRNVIGGI